MGRWSTWDQRMEGEGRQSSSRNWFDIVGLYKAGKRRRAEGDLSGAVMITLCLSFLSVEGLLLHPVDLHC